MTPDYNQRHEELLWLHMDLSVSAVEGRPLFEQVAVLYDTVERYNRTHDTAFVPGEAVSRWINTHLMHRRVRVNGAEDE